MRIKGLIIAVLLCAVLAAGSVGTLSSYTASSAQTIGVTPDQAKIEEQYQALQLLQPEMIPELPLEEGVEAGAAFDPGLDEEAPADPSEPPVADETADAGEAGQDEAPPGDAGAPDMDEAPSGDASTPDVDEAPPGEDGEAASLPEQGPAYFPVPGQE